MGIEDTISKYAAFIVYAGLIGISFWAFNMGKVFGTDLSPWFIIVVAAIIAYIFYMLHNDVKALEKRVLSSQPVYQTPIQPPPTPGHEFDRSMFPKEKF